MQKQRYYIAIDLKSFYASVECLERGLDPIHTNLVVADASRTEKTICLAVSPSLKAYGISGRARLFEVIQKLKEVNAKRKQTIPGQTFTGSSFLEEELSQDSSLKVDYIAAPPRMAYYIEYSTRIYEVYLKYLAPEDIHVYSIDEVMCDVTDYLETYQMTPRELASKMIQDVYETTGITATGGIGTNLYLCKIAMDIVAKHLPPDENGVRIAELNEMTYRQMLWSHRPLTDFWRVGKGYARKLEANGLYTMGDIARCSIGKSTEFYNEDLLYKLFGVNAELLIDHAWGWEPCRIQDIKAYKPENNSIVFGQVLQYPYEAREAEIVIREMADMLSLNLMGKHLVTNQLVMDIGYDIENLTDPIRAKKYRGEVTTDSYGRKIPKHAHGTVNLKQYTASSKMLTDAVEKIFFQNVNSSLLIRRISISANHVVRENEIPKETEYEQLSLFSGDYDGMENKNSDEEKERIALEKEKKLMQARLEIQKKYGKNAILKGINFEKGATIRERNGMIGGHKA